MISELLKIRFMPTPRYALLVIVGLLLATCAITAAVSPAEGSDAWHAAPQTAATVTISIAAIVLGAWTIGVEFSSRTIRLAATVEPDRTLLAIRKLCAATVLLIAFLLAAIGLTLVAVLVMSNIGQSPLKLDDALDSALGLFVVDLLWGLFAFGLALLLRSYAGGVVAALALALALDQALQLIPTVGKYTFGAATEAVSNVITGDPANLGTGIAVLTALLWVAGLNALGTARFLIQDLK